MSHIVFDWWDEYARRVTAMKALADWSSADLSVDIDLPMDMIRLVDEARAEWLAEREKAA